MDISHTYMRTQINMSYFSLVAGEGRATWRSRRCWNYVIGSLILYYSVFISLECLLSFVCFVEIVRHYRSTAAVLRRNEENN